ncbi:hypothetical protein GCM10010207_49420 [Streptomyces atratus]|nr:hypothetical protein GCM10010207_49420 [Streptomyces atratus]
MQRPAQPRLRSDRATGDDHGVGAAAQCQVGGGAGALGEIGQLRCGRMQTALVVREPAQPVTVARARAGAAADQAA